MPAVFSPIGLEKISPKIHRNVIEFISRIWYNKAIEGCAGSVQTIQRGDSSHPVKPSKQPVHSLGAEAARLGLSVGSGVQEPQCESVKRYCPVSYIERKPIPSFRSQAVIRQSICENAVGSAGVRERGECTK